MNLLASLKAFGRVPAVKGVTESPKKIIPLKNFLEKDQCLPVRVQDTSGMWFAGIWVVETINEVVVT